ncbi:MAG: hypothetical protein LAO07_02430 [Acidobacteriia bacterium]|nr:hypothetical protein [Terriglobia bacterium]
MNGTDTLQSGVMRLEKRALILGLAALVVCAAGGFDSPVQFFRSYLLGYIFWLGVALGCAAILMLHHLVGGGWGFPIRRMLESGTRTLLLMAAFTVPLLFGLRQLYVWANPANAPAEMAITGKALYLNIPFFIVRTVIYFAAWILVTHFLNKWSLEQDRTANPDLTHRLQSLSGPGLLIYGLTATFASIDWVMSLEPSWTSTIYGMIFMVTQALSAMSLVIVVMLLLSKTKPLSDLISPLALNDLGNLLLTFTMLWAYLSFSQFLIIWSGNLPEEITWYAARATGGWAWVAVLLIVFHFAVPFLLLLSRFVKRRIRLLAAVATGLILMSLIDLFWLMAPAYDRAGPQFHWMDWMAVIGIGGVWFWRFASQLKRNPLVPLHDPRLPQGATHHA